MSKLIGEIESVKNLKHIDDFMEKKNALELCKINYPHYVFDTGSFLLGYEMGKDKLIKELKWLIEAVEDSRIGLSRAETLKKEYGID